MIITKSVLGKEPLTPNSEVTDWSTVIEPITGLTSNVFFQYSIAASVRVLMTASLVAPNVVDTTLAGSHGVVPGKALVVHCVQEPVRDFASIVPPARMH
jgi:hypothetical protein